MIPGRTARVLALPLGLAALLTARLAPFGNTFDAVLALDMVGAGILAWAHRAGGGALIFAGLATATIRR